MLSVHATRSTTESFWVINFSHLRSTLRTNGKRIHMISILKTWLKGTLAQLHSWGNPQMKNFDFKFHIKRVITHLLWSDKFITTSRQECQRISLEKPQLYKGCRFVGVATRKRSVIWREYQIQRDPLMLCVHATRSITESFFVILLSH